MQKLQNGHEPLYRFRVIVREEQALAAVQRFDGRHILRVQREIKQIEILLHPLLVRGFRDHGHTALHEKAQPEKLVTSFVCQNDGVLSDWQSGACDIAILPFPFDGAKEWMHERLFVCVPPSHALAQHKTLSFSKINGFNFLLRTELGFWDMLCREKMPASRFLVQTDPEVFNELVSASSLPCFTTDYGRYLTAYSDRVNIPLSDREADVTFYLAARDGIPIL